MGKRLVIVGNSTAGLSALRAISRFSEGHEIVVLSREACPAYSPTALPHYIMGHVEEKDLFLNTGAAGTPDGVRLMLSREVVGIDPSGAKIVLDDGQELAFDELLLATGASPVVPPIQGLQGEVALVLRTLEDAKTLMASARNAHQAVILGAGFVGMQCAVALTGMGLETTVVEMEHRVLPAYFGEETASMIRDAFEASGVTFCLGASAVEIGRRPTSVVLSDGEQLQADVLVVATGVLPRTGLLRGSGIETDQGILVNELMQTSSPHVFAAGDVAQAQDFFTGRPSLNPIMLSAAEQGRVAGLNMIDLQERYEGTLAANVLSYFGHTAFAIGSVREDHEGDKHYVSHSPNGRGYHRLVFSEDRLIGAEAVDAKIDLGLLYSLIRSRAVLTSRDKHELDNRPLEKSRILFTNIEEAGKQI
jgi:phenylglyoxylate dehydrogenase epsilon subunit